MDDSVEGHKSEKDLNLEKFVIVEEILSEWEPSERERMPGGSFCSADELFKRVNSKSPSLFDSPSLLHSFLSSRPHLFHLTHMNTVRVRFPEERRRFIEVVRFVRDQSSAVSLQSVLEKFWKDEMEEMKKIDGMGKNEEENREEKKRWMVNGPWRKTPVWNAIKRGGKGIFRVEGDMISLTEEAKANESFFEEIYLEYTEEVVKKLQKNFEEAEKQEESGTARKQRQCNSTQFTLLGLAREAKAKYIKALCLSPNFPSETVYILPNQIGDVNEKHHNGQMMMIRAHDVIGDPEHLKNRFRADEMRAFPMNDIADNMQPTVALSHNWENAAVRKRLVFPGSVPIRDRCLDDREELSAELSSLLEKCGSQFAVSNRQVMEVNNTFSDYIMPTQKMQDEYNSNCEFERIFVKEMDNLIACGVKKIKEHSLIDGEKEEDSYPLKNMVEDLINRSMTTPDAISIIDELTEEELMNEMSKRPHLYRIHDDDPSNISVSFSLRGAIDRLLNWLDTRSIWTMHSLRETLGQGKAGEEWRDESVLELVNGLRPLLIRINDFFSLKVIRSKDGLWMEEDAVMNRGVKTGKGIRKEMKKMEEKENVERDEEGEEMDSEEEEEKRRSKEASENGKSKGRGGFGTKMLDKQSW